MYKIVIGIDGMMCGMCETHVNDIIRRNFKIKKVSSSHSMNETTILTPIIIDEKEIKKVMDPTGYRLTSYKIVEVKKKGLFGK